MAWRIRRRVHPTFPGAGWAFLAVGAALAVLWFGEAFLQSAVVEVSGGRPDGESAQTLLRGLRAPFTFFSLLVVPLLIVGWRCRIPRTLSLRRPKAPLLLLMIPLGVFLQVLIGSFMQWFVTLLPPEIQEQARVTREALLCDTPIQWTVTILAISVSPGLFEELLFRGLLQNGLQVSPLGRKGALLVTAGLFSVAHVPGQGLLTTIPLFLVGLLLGYVALQSGTIWYGVLLHAAFNFTVLWFASVSMGEGDAAAIGAQWPAPMILAALAVLAICAVPLWIWTRPRRAELISGDQVDPELHIELSGPPAAVEPAAQLRPRPTFGPILTAAACLLSLAAPAACYVMTWLHFHPSEIP
jgi:membrane protease YdiL (CAAX protease family)